MAYYDHSESTWSAPARQASWEHQGPAAAASRSRDTSAPNYVVDPWAFAAQFEEIERATDNLMKSGKWFPGQAQAQAMGGGNTGGSGMSLRRESMPPMAGAGGPRGYEYSADPRMGGGVSGGNGGAARHQSMSELDPGRPGSSGLQGFYQGQRFPGGKQSEAEQMLQAKRRMAAQRERELRNYHQEQQYHRTVSGGKTDRALSPNTMSEEDRRDLIARQHRALYGENSSIYGADGAPPPRQDSRVASIGRGPSPLAFDPYGQNKPGADNVVQMPPRADHSEGTTSPAPMQQTFASQQPGRTSSASPGGSPPLAQNPKSGSGVAPIGTRPAPNVAVPGGLNKRSTTPLTPSALSHGVNVDLKDERSTSAASNPTLAAEKGVPGLGGWGSKSGVWGSGKNTLAVQPSVWG